MFVFTCHGEFAWVMVKEGGGIGKNGIGERGKNERVMENACRK